VRTAEIQELHKQEADKARAEHERALADMRLAHDEAISCLNGEHARWETATPKASALIFSFFFWGGGVLAASTAWPRPYLNTLWSGRPLVCMLSIYLLASNFFLLGYPPGVDRCSLVARA
jgi:hypothetical protein